MGLYKPIREFVKVINEPLDVNLEIAHIAYAEAKKKQPRILLFTNPIERATGKTYKMPVLMNLFANHTVVQRIFGAEPQQIAERIKQAHLSSPPERFQDILEAIRILLDVKNIFPKKLKKPGTCQQTELSGLGELPILKSWPGDGGKFITMGQVYTIDPDTGVQNVGMYRLQVIGDRQLAMHWQAHKDGNRIYQKYKARREPMPVTIAIGGDPLYSWCSTAPAPPGIFELYFYGFIRRKRPRLVKSLTNNIWIPEDTDIVIEGTVEPDEYVKEGPFGDHTGYYTPIEEYPLMHVESITARNDAIFYATVVGKPPLEDKYMGYATERIFLPLIQAVTPQLIDYRMPENGVFHNLILCKIRCEYPGDSLKVMHALWGNGQMSFVKHAIFVNEDAPDLNDFKALAKHVLNRLSKERVLISRGVVDALDHSSPVALIGGKLGVDATGEEIKREIEVIDDNLLVEKLKNIDDSVVDAKQYCTESSNPICVIAIKKQQPLKELFEKLQTELKKHLAVVVFVDSEGNDLDNPYMLIWRVTNNIDAERDVWIEEIIGIDATKKTEAEGHLREWPDEVVCDPKTFEKLRKKGLIDLSDEEIKFYQLL